MKWTPQKTITARVGGGGLLGEPERIADEVGDVLDLGALVVVRQDHRVALVSQPLDPVQKPGPALSRNVPLCCDHPATCPACMGSVDLGQIDLSKYSRVGRAVPGDRSQRSAFVYRGAVTVIGVVVRPRSTFAALAGSPRLALGFAAVVGSAIVALVLGLLANQIGGGGGPGTVASLLLPLLFLVYWGAAALIIDAAAGLAGQAGPVAPVPRGERVHVHPVDRLRACSPWSRPPPAPAAPPSSWLAWLTLPLLAWFLVLTALAVLRGVRRHARSSRWRWRCCLTPCCSSS